MKGITIVLIAAAPLALLVWFLRRKRPGVGAEHSEIIPINTGNTPDDGTHSVIYETEPTPKSAFREQLSERDEREPLESSGGERATEQPAAALRAAAVQLQNKAEETAEEIPVGTSHEPPSTIQTPVTEPAAYLTIATALSNEPACKIEGAAENFVPSSSNGQHEIDVPPPEILTANENLRHEDNGVAPNTNLTRVQADTDEMGQADGDGGHPPTVEVPAEVHESNTGSVPKRYRPPPQRPPPGSAAKRPANRESNRGAPAEVLLGISVQLKFDRSGFCEMALLPERTAGLDDEVAVMCGRKPLRLFAQEDWYEDLPLDNICDLLRQGLELKGPLADGRSARWLLTGRDLYVLATHPRASRLVSTSRLALGRSHVVLCTAELLQPVESILAQAGCQGYTRLDGSHGVPSGWIALRDVAPARALPVAGEDPFYAIKPAPDIEIDFEGGLCLRNSVWLAGYPPRIKILGESNLALRVLIDGTEARHAADGSFIVDGYDLAGAHSVYCDGATVSRSYSIEEPLESWTEWPAHPFRQAEICGPLVRLKPEMAGRRAITVPMSNPVLLGAVPGQIFLCPHRNVPHWRGYVPFDAVWALPSYPLIYNKKTGRIIQIANAPVVTARPHGRSALGWCSAILDVSRKRLQIENESPESKACWNEYKKAARNIWRASR